MTRAERSLHRARLNGVEDAQSYYTESSIFALRGNSQAAIDSLQTAYERGFREALMLEKDWRMESLQQNPQYIAIRQQIDRDIEQARAEVESFIVAAL